MVVLFFNGIFGIWQKKCKNTCNKFFAFIPFAMLLSSRFDHHVSFRLFGLIPIIEMPSLYRHEKVTCDNCGTQTTKLNLSRHKKRCSDGTLYCTHRPNFSTKSPYNPSFRIAKKHSAPKPDVAFKCNLCYQEFPGF